MPPRIDILAVGRLSRDLKPAFEHYRRLLVPLCALQVREVREYSLQGRAPAEVLRDEGHRLLAAWPDRPVVVALAVAGHAPDTPAFAGRLGDWLERGGAGFIVGGALGLAPEVLERADEQLSLSPLTLPHQLARVVLAEQLFRAIKIRRGEVYHR